MNRYQSNKTYKDDKLRPYFGTTKLPIVGSSVEDRYIFTVEGDRLDNLANQFYNNTQLWPILALANNLGKGSLTVPPGIQLRIPNFNNAAEFESLIASTERNR